MEGGGLDRFGTIIFDLSAVIMMMIIVVVTIMTMVMMMAMMTFFWNRGNLLRFFSGAIGSKELLDIW